MNKTCTNVRIKICVVYFFTAHKYGPKLPSFAEFNNGKTRFLKRKLDVKKLSG